MINHTPKIITTLLTQLGLAGGSTGWGLTYVRMPTTPDNYILVNGTASQEEDALVKKDGIVEQNNKKGFQIFLRSRSYDPGWAKMEAIRIAMLQVKYQTLLVNGVNYRIWNFKLEGDPLHLPKPDETEEREFFSLNGLATISEI